jgi:serine/threonine protein kinase
MPSESKQKAGSTKGEHRGYFKEESFGGSKYEVSHVAGKGSYGVVWAGRSRQTRVKVAIKHIDRVFQVKEDAIRILRELQFLRMLRHPKIISVENVLLPRDAKTFNDVHIVFELFDTDLSHMIRSETRYDESHRRWIIYQTLHAMRHIHAAGVIHRDLKPGNILINANCDIKVCDLGMARARVPGAANEDVAMWTDYVASRWYRAPELICCYYSQYTQSVDMWSVGCIMAELISRKPIFPGKTSHQQLDLITTLMGSPTDKEMSQLKSSKAKGHLDLMKGKRPRKMSTIYPGTDDVALELIHDLLAFNPNRRATAASGLEHRYFTDIRDLESAQIPSVPVPQFAPDQFEWEHAKKKSVTKERLRELMYEEILTYHSAGVPALEKAAGRMALVETDITQTEAISLE